MPVYIAKRTGRLVAHANPYNNAFIKNKEDFMRVKGVPAKFDTRSKSTLEGRAHRHQIAKYSQFKKSFRRFYTQVSNKKHGGDHYRVNEKTVHLYLPPKISKILAKPKPGQVDMAEMISFMHNNQDYREQYWRNKEGGPNAPRLKNKNLQQMLFLSQYKPLKTYYDGSYDKNHQLRAFLRSINDLNKRPKLFDYANLKYVANKKPQKYTNLLWPHAKGKWDDAPLDRMYEKQLYNVNSRKDVSTARVRGMVRRPIGGKRPPKPGVFNKHNAYRWKRTETVPYR